MCPFRDLSSLHLDISVVVDCEDYDDSIYRPLKVGGLNNNYDAITTFSIHSTILLFYDSEKLRKCCLSS